MTATKQQIDVDAEVREYLDLNDQIDALSTRKAEILNRLRTLGTGQHTTSFGIGVTVSAPPRSFNVAKAFQALTPEQQALCMSPDGKKVRGQLPPVVAESFMEDGTGDPRVTVK